MEERKEVGSNGGASKRLGESSNSKLFLRYAVRVIQDESESKSVWAVTYELHHFGFMLET